MRYISISTPGRAVALAVTGALVGGLLVAAPAQAVQGAAVAAAKAQDPVTSRPEEWSAQLAAVAQGSAVEVSGERTAASRTWANPDYSFTTEASSGISSTRTSDGSWVPIDTTLHSDGTALAPAAPGVPTSVSAGGKAGKDGVSWLATVSLPSASLGQIATALRKDDPSLFPATTSATDGESASYGFGWYGDLPAPVVDGASATYKGVAEGVDLRVTASPGGVETFVDLTKAPAQIPDAGVQVKLPVRTDGLTVTQDEKTGALTFNDPTTGNVVGRIDQIRVWDAPDPKTGESAHQIVLSPQLVRVDKNTQDLVVTVPADFLETDGLQWPVTIDPSGSVDPGKDVYVTKGYGSTNYASDDFLKIGTYDSGTHVHRSFVSFPLGSLGPWFYDASTVVDSAALKVWNWYSDSCTAATTEVRYATGDWDETTLTWNNQPGMSAVQTTNTEAHKTGGSGACAEDFLGGSAGIDVKPLVQGWADGSIAKYGFVLTASETNNSGLKKFWADEYTTASERPALVVTYHHAPLTPSAPKLTGRNPNGWVHEIPINVTGAVSDHDGGDVGADFQITDDTVSTVEASGSDSATPSGGTATVGLTPSPALTQGTQYRARVRATQAGENSAWSATTTFKLDTVPPTVSAPACTYNGGTTLAAGSFAASTPTTALTCTVSVADATSGLYHTKQYLDGSGAQLYSSGTGATRTVTVPLSRLTDGWHQLVITQTDYANNPTSVTFDFGIDAGAFLQPTDATATTSGIVPVQVRAPSGAEIVLQHSEDKGATWTTIPNAALSTTSGGAVTQPVALTTSGSVKDSPILQWNMAATFTDDTATLLRACVHATAGGSTCNASPPTVFLTLDRAGAGGTAAPIGPVSVSMLTGVASVFSSDATLASWAGDESVSRVYTSNTPNLAGPFGLGWTSGLPGGSADWSRLIDGGGGAVVYDSSDTPTGFTATSTVGTYPTSYRGQDDATDLTLVKTSATQFTLTDLSGVVATFTQSAGTTFTVSQVTDPEISATAQYTYDPTTKYPTRILAPLPPGVSASSCPVGSTGSWVAGCADLLLTYSSSRVSTVTWRGFEQPTSGGTPALRSIDVACYRYDGTGRLTQQWDPRENTTGGYAACGTGSAPSGALVTAYGYDASTNRLTSITPPGLQPYTIGYDGSGRVTTVSRTHTASYNSGATETVTLGYGVNIGAASSGSDDSHPDLTATAIAAWWPYDTTVQPVAAPVTATAVWPAGATTTDLRQAQVTAFDTDGDVTNTAAFSGTGQAGWQITTQVYDPNGMPVASLSAANRARVLAKATDPDVAALGLTNQPSAAVANALASLSTYSYLVDDNGDGIKDTRDIADLTDTYGPLHLTDTTGTGALIAARTHDHTDYGTLATGTAIPTGASSTTSAWVHHPVTDTQSAYTLDDGDITSTATTTSYAYAIPDGAGGYDTTGWTMHTPTQTTTTVTGGTDIVSRTVLDPTTGNILQQRQPSAAGDTVTSPSNAGTRVTKYYSTGSYTGSNCAATVWYGMPCKSGPASGSTTPTTSTKYGIFADPIVTTDVISGSTDRVTTLTLANSGYSSRVTAAAITGGIGTTTPSSSTSYDTSTGLPTSTTSNGYTATTGYDDFGRPISVDDGNSGVVDYAYENTTGRLSTITRTQGGTSVGTSTYTYNSSTDKRGLPTTLTQTTLGTITGTYDPDGQLLTQSMPAGTGTLTQNHTYDTTGTPTTLSWAKDGTTWLSDTQTSDSHGQWTSQTTSLNNRSRIYGYDTVGRLTSVNDTIAGQCTTRTYGFDVNSNRTSYASYDPTGTGACQTSTAATTTTTSYNTADQPTLPGSGTYDAYGRTTTQPASLTPDPANGDITIAYYTNDLVRSLTRGATSRTFTLDAAGRLACSRTKPSATTDSSNCGATTTTGVTDTTQHFDNATSDSPAWTLTRTGAATPITSRDWNTLDLAGDLLAVITTPASGPTVTTIQLSNLHGDITTTSSPSAVGAPDGAAITTDEYGNPTTTPATTPTYNYLGTAQRQTDLLTGIALMGVRLYTSTTGRFLSTDPIYGGNATTYGYPVDPINITDLTGKSIFDSISNWFQDNKEEILDLGLGITTVLLVAAVCGASAGIGCVVAAATVVGGIVGMDRYSLLSDEHTASGYARAAAWGAVSGGLLAFLGAGVAAEGIDQVTAQSNLGKKFTRHGNKLIDSGRAKVALNYARGKKFKKDQAASEDLRKRWIRTQV